MIDVNSGCYSRNALKFLHKKKKRIINHYFTIGNFQLLLNTFKTISYYRGKTFNSAQLKNSMTDGIKSSTFVHQRLLASKQNTNKNLYTQIGEFYDPYKTSPDSYGDQIPFKHSLLLEAKKQSETQIITVTLIKQKIFLFQLFVNIINAKN